MTAVAPRHDAQASPHARLPPGERYLHETRDAAWRALLRRRGVADLQSQRIVEIGCAEGAFLRALLHYGAAPERLVGVDLDPSRLSRAKATGVTVLRADGAALPLAAGAFDLAFAFTFFSSVRDPERRAAAAQEAMRVVRPGGLLVVYDFWVNPFNRGVRPLGAGEVARLFAPRRVEVERVTLAPPVARALGGRRGLCRALERLPFLCTHLLAGVTKE